MWQFLKPFCSTFHIVIDSVYVPRIRTCVCYKQSSLYVEVWILFNVARVCIWSASSMLTSDSQYNEYCYATSILPYVLIAGHEYSVLAFYNILSPTASLMKISSKLGSCYWLSLHSTGECFCHSDSKINSTEVIVYAIVVLMSFVFELVTPLISVTLVQRS